MKTGFTGTRHGMTNPQIETVWRLLAAVTELHHGDCVGADAQAHAMAQNRKISIVTHPPIDPKLRAYCEGAIAERDPKPYLERNRAIVDETHLLIAAPHTHVETLRSGTWATVRYARRKVEIWIVEQDGTVVRELT